MRAANGGESAQPGGHGNDPERTQSQNKRHDADSPREAVEQLGKAALDLGGRSGPEDGDGEKHAGKAHRGDVAGSSAGRIVAMGVDERSSNR